MFPEPEARPPASDEAVVTPAAAVPEPSADELLAATVPPLVVVQESSAMDGESSNAERQEAVLEVVEAWARAWSNQDVTSYLRHYGDAFQPPQGMSRHRWERQRRQRLQGPQFIEVELSDLEVQWADHERAAVTFVQHYRSDKYRDQVRKQLQLVRSGDAWQIVGERNVQ